VSKPHRTAVPRHQAPITAELTRIVDRLRAVADKHDLSITDVKKTLARMLRRVEQDQDFDLGLLDVSRKDRAALKARGLGTSDCTGDPPPRLSEPRVAQVSKGTPS
jgi:hypothetical protein